MSNSGRARFERRLAERRITGDVVRKQVVLDWLGDQHRKILEEMPGDAGVIRSDVVWRLRELFKIDFDFGQPEQMRLTQENAVGPYRKDGGATQRQAAYDNYPRSGSQRYRVLMALMGTGNGMTRDELARSLELPDSSVDARVWELKRGGWIAESGLTRETAQGSQANLLFIPDDVFKRIAKEEGLHT